MQSARNPVSRQRSKQISNWRCVRYSPGPARNSKPRLTAAKVTSGTLDSSACGSNFRVHSSSSGAILRLFLLALCFGQPCRCAICQIHTHTHRDGQTSAWQSQAAYYGTRTDRPKIVHIERAWHEHDIAAKHMRLLRLPALMSSFAATASMPGVALRDGCCSGRCRLPSAAVGFFERLPWLGYGTRV